MPSAEDINMLHGERTAAAKEFFKEELGFKDDVSIETHWSMRRNILWVTFPSEHYVNTLFRFQAELGNPKIKLLKYTPPWCFERNRELEILCRMQRELNPELSFTKIVHQKQRGYTLYKGSC